MVDSGAGIAEDDLPRVTKKFYKADNRYPGSGLGLSIVAEIVRLHGGQLQIESKLGCETSVTVILPLNSRSAQVSEDAAKNPSR